MCGPEAYDKSHLGSQFPVTVVRVSTVGSSNLQAISISELSRSNWTLNAGRACTFAVIFEHDSVDEIANTVVSMTHGNLLTTNASYDLDYRLTSLQVLNGASVVQGKTYAYSDGMNLTSITDVGAPTQNVALWHSPSNLSDLGRWSH